eukprot:928078-Prorocentrum_minimum.AAC.1
MVNFTVAARRVKIWRPVRTAPRSGSSRATRALASAHTVWATPWGAMPGVTSAKRARRGGRSPPPGGAARAPYAQVRFASSCPRVKI